MASNKLEIEPLFSYLSYCVLVFHACIRLFNIATKTPYKNIAQTMFQNQVAEIISLWSILLDIHDYITVRCWYVLMYYLQCINRKTANTRNQIIHICTCHNLKCYCFLWHVIWMDSTSVNMSNACQSNLYRKRLNVKFDINVIYYRIIKNDERLCNLNDIMFNAIISNICFIA